MSPPSPKNYKSHFSADDFDDIFTPKVGEVRASTSSAPPPMIKKQLVTTLFSSFKPVSVDVVTQLLSCTPAKHCLSNPVPIWLWNVLLTLWLQCLARYAMRPYNPEIFLRHTSQPMFFRVSRSLKRMLTKPTRIDQYLSWVLFVERVVATRFTAHSERYKLFPSNQSAYRRHHNTETAVISIMNIRAIDPGEVTALILLNPSAVFDTVDHFLSKFSQSSSSWSLFTVVYVSVLS